MRQALGAQRRIVAASQGPRGQHRGGHKGRRHQTFAQLDEHQRQIRERQTDAAVFLRNHESQPPCFRHLDPAGPIEAGLHEAVCAYALEFFVALDEGDGTVLNQHLLLGQNVDFRLQTDVFHMGSGVWTWAKKGFAARGGAINATAQPVFLRAGLTYSTRLCPISS
ncbi:MAG: hypothetical protein IPK48_07675 [Gammaproteobacteria bacterium]|nr:hypothetical protein [Gammaproteobacteria bacterium]